MTGSSNISIGESSGRFIANGSTQNEITNESVFLGNNTKALANNQTNQIVIGDNATGAGSNTVTLGNTSITSTILRGTVTAGNGTLLAGTGTTNFIPKFTASGAVGDSSIFDNGNVGIGTTIPTEKLDVVGNGKFSGSINSGSITANGIITGNQIASVSGITGANIRITAIPEYADNAAALANFEPIGRFYRTGDILKVVH